MSLFLTIFVVGIVVTGTSVLKSNRARTETAFLLTGQAAQFARSGLTDAINWFRRQPTQPVLDFAPRLDTGTDPQVLDTEDPDIGLVRQFRISGSVWGRYEVWKRWDADPDIDRFTWRQKMQVDDVSLQRGRKSLGSVWRLRCVGYVFDQRDPDKGFRERPNRVMATEVLEAEISRLAFALPGQSSICARRGDSIRVKKNGRILGGSDGAGVFYPSGTGDPTVESGGEITGVPAAASGTEYNDSIDYVFGVTDDGLRSMADNHLTNANDFPALLPDGSITVLEGANININFNSSRPLAGSGIVVIRGNVTISPGSAGFFSGLLYVEGNLDVHAPTQLRGAVIVTGNMTIQGIGDFADVIYDDGTITALQQVLSHYRMSRSARRRIVRD
ncbi:MAG: hypothetical protein ACYTGO_02010 [Planctomycetota bacterium]|jgi:hypothetical protein